MFICIECGELFEEPIRWTERHGFDYGPYEEWTGSPCCHGGYEEADRCGCCDNWIEGDYFVTDNGILCQDCYVDEEYDEE